MSRKRIKPHPQKKGKKINLHVSESRSYDQYEPYFSLTHIQKTFSLSHCEKAEKAAFSDTLHKLSQKTWSEIKSLPRHGAGFEKINRESIKASIPSHIQDDVILLFLSLFAFMAKLQWWGIDHKEYSISYG